MELHPPPQRDGLASQPPGPGNAILWETALLEMTSADEVSRVGPAPTWLTLLQKRCHACDGEAETRVKTATTPWTSKVASQPHTPRRPGTCSLQGWEGMNVMCFAPTAPGRKDSRSEGRRGRLGLQGGHSCQTNEVSCDVLMVPPRRTQLTWVSSSVTSKFSLFRCLFTNVMRDCRGKGHKSHERDPTLCPPPPRFVNRFPRPHLPK